MTSALMVAAVLGAGLLILRYDMEVIEAGSYPHAFMLDRWTGEIYYINPYGRFPVERKANPPKPPS
jgi:hypothetical protein